MHPGRASCRHSVRCLCSEVLDLGPARSTKPPGPIFLAHKQWTSLGERGAISHSRANDHSCPNLPSVLQEGRRNANIDDLQESFGRRLELVKRAQLSALWKLKQASLD